MTRSVRRVPIVAACGGSQGRAKRCCNRIMRRWNRTALLLHGEEAQYLRHDEALNVWAFPSDGTRRYRIFAEYPWQDWRRWFRWVLAK